jgi:hypothetical protein
VILGRIAATTLGGWAAVRRPDPAATAAARRAATATLAVVFALVAVNPFMVKVFVNGLETGLSVTLLAFLLLIGAGTRADRGWLAAWLAGASGWAHCSRSRSWPAPTRSCSSARSACGALPSGGAGDVPATAPWAWWSSSARRPW